MSCPAGEGGVLWAVLGGRGGGIRGPRGKGGVFSVVLGGLGGSCEWSKGVCDIS